MKGVSLSAGKFVNHFVLIVVSKLIWRHTCDGIMTGKFSDEMKNRREEIIGEDVGFPCDNRGRRCCAAIGLISHQIHCPRTLPLQGSRTLMNTNDDNTTQFQNYASNVFSSSCN